MIPAGLFRNMASGIGSTAMGAARKAALTPTGIGAIAGGVAGAGWGMVSDDTSVIGGVVGGAALGAAAGRYGTIGAVGGVAARGAGYSRGMSTIYGGYQAGKQIRGDFLRTAIAGTSRIGRGIRAAQRAMPARVARHTYGSTRRANQGIGRVVSTLKGWQ